MEPRPTTPPTTFACPSCSSTLMVGCPRCESCGVRLVGPDAVRLWHVDRQIATLRVERDQLLVRLRLPGPVAPYPGSPAIAGMPGAAGSRRPPVSAVSRLLLTLGVFCVSVGAAVFVAVAWTLLGIAGQAAILLTLTVATFAAVPRFRGRGLASTGTAFEVLGCLLVAVDLHGARRLGLVPGDHVTMGAYWTVAGLVVAAVYAGVARLVRSSVVLHSAAALALTVSAIAFAGNADATDERSWRCLLAAALLAAPARTLLAAARSRIPARIVVGSAAVLLFVSVRLAVELLVEADVLGDAAQPALAVLAAAVVVLSYAVVVTTPTLRGFVRGSRMPGDTTIAVVLAGGLAGTSAGGFLRLSSSGSLVAAGVVVAGALGVRVLAERDGRLRLRLRGAAVSLAVAPIVMSVLSKADAAEDMVILAVTAAAAAVLALVSGAARSPWRAGLLVLTAGALVDSSLLVGEVVDAHAAVARVIALVVTATALAGTAAWWAIRAATGDRVGLHPATRLEEPVLGLGACVAGLVALGASSEGAAWLTASAAATLGLLAFAYACRPHRQYVVFVASLAFAIADWALASDADVSTIEAYSLPFAALLAAAGVFLRLRRAAVSSWVLVGPAVSVALWPSALAAIAGDGWIRPVSVLAAAVAILLVGLRFRWSAALVTASAVVFVVGGNQLVPYAALVPRWVTLSLIGVVLLWLGARYEDSRRHMGTAWGWLRTLS